MKTITRAHRSDDFRPGTAEHTILQYFERIARGEKSALITFRNKTGPEALQLAVAVAYFPASRHYLEEGIPATYFCAHCMQSHPTKKLWREINTIPLFLLCAEHAAKQSGFVLDNLDHKGEHVRTNGRFVGTSTPMIGYFAPAVPTEDGSYWPYHSIPDCALIWWQSLPNYS